MVACAMGFHLGRNRSFLEYSRFRGRSREPCRYISVLRHSLNSMILHASMLQSKSVRGISGLCAGPVDWVAGLVIQFAGSTYTGGGRRVCCMLNFRTRNLTGRSIVNGTLAARLY